jgi:hypothetical protein
VIQFKHLVLKRTIPAESGTLDKMLSSLKDSYDVYCQKYETCFKRSIVVQVYQDQKVFKPVGWFKKNDWVIAQAIPNQIFIVSPNNPGKFHNYDSVFKGLRHELVHTVLINKNKHIRYG